MQDWLATQCLMSASASRHWHGTNTVCSIGHVWPGWRACKYMMPTNEDQHDDNTHSKQQSSISLKGIW